MTMTMTIAIGVMISMMIALPGLAEAAIHGRAFDKSSGAFDDALELSGDRSQMEILFGRFEVPVSDRPTEPLDGILFEFLFGLDSVLELDVDLDVDLEVLEYEIERID